MFIDGRSGNSEDRPPKKYFKRYKGQGVLDSQDPPWHIKEDQKELYNS